MQVKDSPKERDLGKANQGVLRLKGWPSLLFLVKQELWGGFLPYHDPDSE